MTKKMTKCDIGGRGFEPMSHLERNIVSIRMTLKVAIIPLHLFFNLAVHVDNRFASMVSSFSVQSLSLIGV